MSKLKTEDKKNKHQKPLNPYSIDKFAHIRPGVKIGFLKFWVSGAVFFLTFTAFNIAFLDLLVIHVLLMTLSVEYVTNKVILWMNYDKQPTLKYLPHHAQRRSIKSLLWTLLYVICLVLGSIFAIEGLLSIGIPSIGMILFGFEAAGIDPITYGLVFLSLDYLWISIKNIWLHHQSRAKTKE